MKLLFISCCCLLFSRSLNTNLNTIKYFLESAESKNMKEFINFALLMTRLCLFMICQVIILLTSPAWDEICQSELTRPAWEGLTTLSASLRQDGASSSHLPSPNSFNSGTSGPELCWFIHWSNQTGMTIQNVNKCNICSSQCMSVIFRLRISPRHHPRTANMKRKYRCCFSESSRLFLPLCSNLTCWERSPLSNIDIASYSALCQHCTFKGLFLLMRTQSHLTFEYRIVRIAILQCIVYTA